ncbi:hypothetical protein NBRC10513_003919 [Rhodotorula toruloides]|nr:putative Aminoadipate-semialdehyde dehydrogenase-phosphopantetheinyl transferase [Rhodotorula toruloides]
MLVYLARKSSAFADGPADDNLSPHTSLELLLRYVDSGSRQAISKFRFLRDARRCLLGRLLARYAALAQLDGSDLTWSSLSFDRSDRGKPYVVNLPSGISYDYSISHDSDLVILAASAGPRDKRTTVGVDVMRIAVPWEGGSTDELVETMRDQLDPRELRQIRSAAAQHARLALALAFWTLKEAYIKAIGEGLHFDLRRLHFDLDGAQGAQAIGSTSRLAGRAFVDRTEAVGWRFRLAKLAGRTAKENYWLATAWHDADGKGEVELCTQKQPEQVHEVSLEQLLARAEAVD